MPVASDPKLAFALRRPFAEQVAFFRGKLGNQVPTATWRDLWKSQHDRAFMVAGAAKADLLADLAGAVDAAIAQGETLAQFRKRFKQIVSDRGWRGWTGEGSKAGEAWRTRVIYETNLLTSYSAGRLAQLKAGGYRYWMYKHSDSVRHPRPHHQALNGVVRPADDAFWQTHYPPNGWNCFPGDTLVRADARLGQRFFYRGKMVELRSASGKRLALTINHPVLTGRGWIAAGEVQAGDKMIQAGVNINAALIGVVHNPQPPARADNLFQALAAQGFRVIPMATDDFHGDAGSGEGEVHIAGSDGVLVDVVHAALGHGGGKPGFNGALAGDVETADIAGSATNQAAVVGDAVLSQNAADGGFGQAETASNGGLADVASPVHRNNLALDVVVSSIGNSPGSGHQAALPVAGGLFGLPPGAHAVASVSDGDVVLAQDSGKSAAGMPGLFSKLLEANAGLVATDEVVDVRQYDWAGHVYDFSTETGLILAGGLVVSNCRCRAVGVDGPRSAARLGGDMNKPLPEGWSEINPKTGEPVGIDKGWGYMPGGTADSVRGLLPRMADDPPIGRPVLPPICGRGAADHAEGCPGPLPPPRLLDKRLLLPEGRHETYYMDAFLDAFGATRKAGAMFVDATGERLLISDALFLNREKTALAGKPIYKTMKRGRERWLLVLADTIKHPQEIWEQWEWVGAREWMGAREVMALRRRYLVAWEQPEGAQPGLSVFEWAPKRWWSGVTTFPPELNNAEYLSQVRTGFRRFKA